MLCIWWDCQSTVQKEYLEKGKKMNSKMYSEMLIHVDPAIKAKCQNEFYYKKVMFHQDNVRPYVSAFNGSMA